MERPSFIRWHFTTAAHCGVCGAVGDFTMQDCTMNRFLCPECIEPALMAHRALREAGIERPEPWLSARNP